MLFGYPIEATQENWLHDALYQMIETIHAHCSSGTLPPEWPEIIPEIYREKLKKRIGLKNRIIQYQKKAQRLSAKNRDKVSNALRQQNDIESLLNGVSDCDSIKELPKSVQAPIKSLFEFAFDLLTDLKIRDRQYKIIHDAIGYKLCPFCGYEYFSAPIIPDRQSGKREALDHYLAESLYPMAGVNLKNLAPMGTICNSKYKLAKDILHNDLGVRRRAFNPYQAPGLNINLERSIPNTEIDGPLISEWIIEFSEDSEEVQTWDDVFGISDRYRDDFLTQDFNQWLNEFRAWIKSISAQFDGDDELLNAIHRYAEFQNDCGFGDRAFLKAAVFKLLHRVCSAGNQRVFQVMRDLANMTGTQQ